MAEAKEQLQAPSCVMCADTGGDIAATCAAGHIACPPCFAAYARAFARLGVSDGVMCAADECANAMTAASTRRRALDGPRLVRLGPLDTEYKSVVAQFTATMAKAPIDMVLRVENAPLRAMFEACKARLTRQHGDARERVLFHGTSRAASGGIAREGFDLRRMGSKHGTAYGPGAYFGATAAVSHGYTKLDTHEQRCMLICRVLLGGKDDSAKGPQMYIVNREQQLLPTHVIYYQSNI